MNKERFLAELRVRLAGASQTDIEKTLDYYREMIDDHMEDGLTAEEAVSALGTLDEIVAQVLATAPTEQRAKEPARPSRKLRGWEILLLVLGSPLWLTLLIAAFVVLLSVFVVLTTVVVTLYAIDLAIATSGVALLASSLISFVRVDGITGLFLLGTGLICAGLSILFFFGANLATRGVVALSRLLVRFVRSWFVGKEKTK